MFKCTTYSFLIQKSNLICNPQAMHDVDEFASSSKQLEKCRIKSLAKPHDYSQSINVLYNEKLYVCKKQIHH